MTVHFKLWHWNEQRKISQKSSFAFTLFYVTAFDKYKFKTILFNCTASFFWQVNTCPKRYRVTQPCMIWELWVLSGSMLRTTPHLSNQFSTQTKLPILLLTSAALSHHVAQLSCYFSRSYPHSVAQLCEELTPLISYQLLYCPLIVTSCWCIMSYPVLYIPQSCSEWTNYHIYLACLLLVKLLA